MYMPILRGKRFELLALRDLADQGKVSSKIVPIIEPVRAQTTTTDLRRAIDGWLSSGGSLGVVVNPEVGDLKAPVPEHTILHEISSAYSGNTSDSTETQSPLTDRLIPVLRVPPSPRDYARGLEIIVEELGENSNVMLWLTDAVATNAVAEPPGLARLSITHILASEARAGKRVARNFDPQPAVVAFADRFPAKLTNSEYPDQREQVFTEEHIYYRDDGLAGFADYGTIGDGFRDGGGAPKYVVIHWTYQHPSESPRTSPVYLQHFRSEEASVVAPVQAKYADAADKLVQFCDRENLRETPGTKILRDYHRQEGFPGLGMLKKISVMNHLTVMDWAIRDESV